MVDDVGRNNTDVMVHHLSNVANYSSNRRQQKGTISRRAELPSSNANSVTSANRGGSVTDQIRKPHHHLQARHEESKTTTERQDAPLYEPLDETRELMD